MTVNPMHPSLPLEPEPGGSPGANPQDVRGQTPNSGENGGQGTADLVNREWSPETVDPKDSSTWYVPGRYQGPEDVVRAKVASDQEAQRLNHTVQALQNEMEQFRADWESRAANPPEPQGPDLNALKERLANAGIAEDAFGVFEELANWRAQEIVQQTLAPLAQSAQARNALIGEHPQYAADEQAMWHYLGTNPSVKRKFDRLYGSDPEAALEWAYTKFSTTRAQGVGPVQGQAGPAPAPPNAMPSTNGNVHGQSENRQHGQVMTQSYRPASAGMSAPSADRDQQEHELWRRGLRNGDYSQSAYTQSRLDFLTDPNSPGAHPVLAQLAAARGRDGGPPQFNNAWSWQSPSAPGAPPIGGGQS